MTVNLAAIGNTEPPTTVTWDSRDCALFALACSARFEDSELLVPRADRPLTVLPAFPLALLSADASRRADPLLGAGEFSGRVQVLAKQALTLHAPVPDAGQAAMTTRLSGIFDTGRAAIVVLETAAVDPADGSALFTTETVMHIAGEGGFEGSPIPQPLRVETPETPPTISVVTDTLPVQSLLYGIVARDFSGIHMDRDAANAAGLKGPILAGHNLLGIASRIIVSGIAGGDASCVRSISGRFVRPSYNGDTLSVHVWSGRRANGAPNVHFRMLDQEGNTVLDSGQCLVAR